jgi:hypothetical protein
MKTKKQKKWGRKFKELHFKMFSVQEIFCYGQLNKKESFLLSNIEAE